MPPSPADDLPPVQPPSAGFLVQLFVVPGIIVAIIVVVWVLVDWLAHMESDPQKYVDGLRRNGDDAWRQADNLAEMLHSSRGDELKGNARLAATLAEILDERIAAGKMDESSINLRFFLSKALGEFNTPDGLPVLLRAATTNRDPKETPVREAAIDAISSSVAKVPAENSGGSVDRQALMTVLLEASRDPEAAIRLRAAHALGVVGGEQASSRLVKMLDDPQNDVAFNAAISLANRGDPQSIDTLLKMINPESSRVLLKPSDTDAKSTAADGPDRQVDAGLLVAGLRALSTLADMNPDADLRRAEPLVARLRDRSFPPEVRDGAMALSNKLEKRLRPAGAATH
jgi:HEAT repeats